MKRAITAAAVLLCAATGAVADERLACREDPRAHGLTERMEQMREQMDRIEWTTDRSEQRKLMDLHMKKMREGMRELRRREAGEGCRMEMMHAMMEQLMRHQLVEQEAGVR